MLSRREKLIGGVLLLVLLAYAALAGTALLAVYEAQKARQQNIERAVEDWTQLIPYDQDYIDNL